MSKQTNGLWEDRAACEAIIHVVDLDSVRNEL